MVNIVVTTDPSLFTGIKMLCCVIFHFMNKLLSMNMMWLALRWLYFVCGWK